MWTIRTVYKMCVECIYLWNEILFVIVETLCDKSIAAIQEPTESENTGH